MMSDLLYFQTFTMEYEDWFGVKKGQMVGHHFLDKNTPCPVSVSKKNEQGIKRYMRGKYYGKNTHFYDARLPVGKMVNTRSRSDESFTVALVPTITKYGMLYSN